MENTKIIELDDMGDIKKFRIRLFDVLEGLDFLDEAVGRISGKEKLTIKPFLSTLVKLAVPLDTTGTMPLLGEGRFLTLQEASVLVKNPLTLIELGFRILEFQKVFIQSSPHFQGLIRTLEEKLNIKISD